MNFYLDRFPLTERKSIVIKIEGSVVQIIVHNNLITLITFELNYKTRAIFDSLSKIDFPFLLDSRVFQTFIFVDVDTFDSIVSLELMKSQNI